MALGCLLADQFSGARPARAASDTDPGVVDAGDRPESKGPAWAKWAEAGARALAGFVAEKSAACKKGLGLDESAVPSAMSETLDW